MYEIFMAVSLAAVVTAQTAVVAVIHQVVDGFNKGDMKIMAATCAEQTSILDEFPPHEWHGAGDYDADAKKNGITDGVVTISNPTHVDVAGDRAYVVVPANYSFKLKGKAAGETGSGITLALVKSAAGWKITGWAWAKH
jgi:hypothetical protein